MKHWIPIAVADTFGICACVMVSEENMFAAGALCTLAVFAHVVVLFFLFAQRFMAESHFRASSEFFALILVEALSCALVPLVGTLMLSVDSKRIEQRRAEVTLLFDEVASSVKNARDALGRYPYDLNELSSFGHLEATYSSWGEPIRYYSDGAAFELSVRRRPHGWEVFRYDGKTRAESNNGGGFERVQ